MNRLFKFIKEAQNATQYPAAYDFEFLEPGLVNYKDIECGICNLDKEVIDAMLPSMIGKPLTILHQKAKPEDLEKISNGNVFNVYYDQPSGKYRCKFIATTDEAHKNIAKGWKVSCAYDVHKLGPGGFRNAVPYQQSILNGTFTHLALVPEDKARYEDSTGRIVDNAMLVFNNSIGEATLLRDKPIQEAKSMLKFKFHFPVSIESVANSVDSEKTLVEVSKGKKVSVKDLIAAYNSKSEVLENSEEVSEDSLLEIQNSKGETIKVSVKDLVEAYNGEASASDDEAAKKKEDDEKEKTELENAMSDDEKKDYGKMDDEAKCSYRKNMKERKNAKEEEEKKEADKKVRENALKVKMIEEAREEAKGNLKTFTVVNSKGKNLPAEVVSGTKDDGSRASGAQRGKAHFDKKFKKA